MREGGMLWVKVEGETAAVRWGEAGEGLFARGYSKDEDEEAIEGKAVMGEEVNRGSSTSSSPDNLMPLRKEGEQGGVPTWIPSDREEERLLLAMELAVGFM